MTKELVRKNGTINAKNMFEQICDISDKLKSGAMTPADLAVATASKAQQLNKLRSDTNEKLT